MTPFLALLVGLATYRLTRLVTADRITQGLRQAAVRRSKWLGYLVTCDWCLSIWIAPAPTVLALLWPENRAVWAVLVGLAASALTGLFSLIEARLDRE